MRQILAIVQTQCRLVFRNKGYLILMLVMPFCFTTLYAALVGRSAGAKPVPLAAVDRDGSFAAGRLVSLLSADRSLTVRLADAGQVEQLLADHAVAAGVMIPAGFEQAVSAGAQPVLQIITPPGGAVDLGVRPAVGRAAAEVAANYRLAVAVAGSDQPAAMAAAYDRVAAERTAVVVGTAVHTATAGSPALKERLLGFTVLFVMLMVLMFSGGILQERRDGTWGRVLVAPLQRASVLSAYLVSACLIGLCQFAVLAVGLATLFRIDWGPLLPLFAMALATILCAAAMGLFLAGIVATTEQQAIVGVMVVVAGSMLGGLYWPIDLMGRTMQIIGHLTPQAWAMDGLRAVVLSGAGFDGIALPLAVLLGMTLVFAGAGLRRIRWE